jgi:hypothetical protein
MPLLAQHEDGLEGAALQRSQAEIDGHLRCAREPAGHEMHDPWAVSEGGVVWHRRAV